MNFKSSELDITKVNSGDLLKADRYLKSWENLKRKGYNAPEIFPEELFTVISIQFLLENKLVERNQARQIRMTLLSQEMKLLFLQQGIIWADICWNVQKL